MSSNNKCHRTIKMSPEEDNWKIENDLCRCCHSEGRFKNLAEPRTSKGQSNIYADLLKECYNIDMVPVPGLLCMATYTICEACIIRLQEAVDFREQVLKCEQRFNEMFNRNCISVGFPAVTVEVKKEFPDTDDDLVIKPDHDENNDDVIIFEDDDDVKYLSEEVGKKKKHKTRKSAKSKTCKRTKRKNAQQTSGVENEVEKKKKGRVVKPKFFLKEVEDYTLNGTVYKCAKCDKTYDKLNTLRFHVKAKHYKIPKYKCSICMEEFMTAAPWTVHKLEAHNVDDRFKCMACNKIFNTKIQLRKHNNNYHMLGEKYKCEFCDYESFSFEGVYKHKFKHKTVKDHHCKFCNKAFLRKTTLDLHERIHTGDRRKVCTVCGQAFVQKASLNYHMTKYHPEVNF